MDPKGTLMQVWKAANNFAFKWKWYVDFALKHLLRFQICVREISKRFVHKHSETTEYVKNYLASKELSNFAGK